MSMSYSIVSLIHSSSGLTIHLQTRDNNHMKQTFVSLTVIALFIFSLSPSWAIDTSDTEASDQAAWDKSQQNNSDLMKAGKLSTVPHPTSSTTSNPNLANRCDQVTAKINNRLNVLDEKKNDFNNRYVQYQTVVTNKVAEWKAKGCNTTAVEADLTTLTQKLADFTASFRDFVTSLQGSRAYVCGSSQGKFAGQVSTAHQKLLVMKGKAVALRTFVVSVMRPDVKTLRATCETLHPTPKVTGGSE
jgi:hypothetical protein